MPLHRLMLKNECGLGRPELYRDVNGDDPASVLDGVVASGLVGLLRQLANLAEFSIDVCRSLQEQVDVTASRTHGMTVRVKCLEDALPSLEKAVLAQTSHIHFAYTTGCDWHPHIECKHNNLNSNNLPAFILDNYVGCRQTPNLHLLDRFDLNGPGSCLKRYSDPTLFRGLSSNYNRAYVCRSQIYKKARRTKKRRPSSRIKDALIDVSFPKPYRRGHIASCLDGQSSVCQATSTSDTATTCDPEKSIFDTEVDSEFRGCIFPPSYSLQEMEPTEHAYSKPNLPNGSIQDVKLGQKQHEIVYFIPSQSSFGIKDVCNRSYVTQVEKAEIKHHGDEPLLLPEVHSGNIHKTVENQEYAIYENTKPKVTVSNINLCDNKRIKQGTLLSGTLCCNEQTKPEIVEPIICCETQTNGSHISETDVPRVIFKAASEIIDPDTICGIQQIDAENIKFGIIEYNENIIAEDSEPNEEGKPIFVTDGNFEPVKFEPYASFKFEAFLPEVVESCTGGSKPGKFEAGAVFNFEKIKPEMVFPQNFINGDGDQFIENPIQESAVHDELEVGDPVNLATTFYDGEYTCNSNHMSEEVGKGNIVDQREEFVNIYTVYDRDSVRNTDEIESECESYLDALNTIESESDNDTVCEPKRELEEISCSDSIDAISELLLCPSIDMISDFGHVDDKSLCFVESETCFSSKEILSEHEDMTTVMKFSERCSLPETVVGDDGTRDLDDSVGTPFNNDSRSSSSMESAPHFTSPEKDVAYTVSTPYISTLEKDMTSFHHLENHAVECSTVKSAILWTNGGLLGLRPSKPTDCMVTEQNKEAMIVKDDVIFNEESIVLCDNDEMNESMNVLKEGSQINVNYANFEHHKICYSDQENHISSRQPSCRYQTDETILQYDTISVGCVSRGKQTNGSDVKATMSDSKHNNGGSTEFCETSNIISGNGVQRKTLPILGCVDELVFSRCNLINQCATSEDQTCDFAKFPPSPPLEPIKIEFCPTNTFDTPELKLKFLDRTDDRECISDVLHSFQLVSESGFLLHDISYDSDDKKFNESSRYAEDDCLYSDSDSIVEQFEPESLNSSKCDENFGDSGVDNRIEHCFKENTVELPFSQFTEIPYIDLECMDTLVDAKITKISDKIYPLTSKHSPESTCLLSVAQETAEKPCLHSPNDSIDIKTKTVVQSTFSNKQGRSHIGKKSISGLILNASVDTDQQDKNLKWNEENETRLFSPYKSIKPKNDFLHQIRSKSFNLRHRELARPILTRNISVGVATILEKARAIRKDVASDGEDADTWSDS